MDRTCHGCGHGERFHGADSCQRGRYCGDGRCKCTGFLDSPQNDPVNHPSHYTRFKGLEVIQLTEQMNFNLGNVVKYVTRAGHKDDASEVEDLEKAQWYLAREIERVKNKAEPSSDSSD